MTVTRPLQAFLVESEHFAPLDEWCQLQLDKERVPLLRQRLNADMQQAKKVALGTVERAQLCTAALEETLQRTEAVTSRCELRSGREEDVSTRVAYAKALAVAQQQVREAPPPPIVYNTPTWWDSNRGSGGFLN